MKAKLIFYEHSSNGLSLFVTPETEAERVVLQALWKHGQLNTCNGIADRSGQGFCIKWKMSDEAAGQTERGRPGAREKPTGEAEEAIA